MGQIILQEANKKIWGWCYKDEMGKCDRGDWIEGCIDAKDLFDLMTFELKSDW